MNQQLLIDRIHGAAKPVVMAITGGGSGAIAALLEVPGGSATMLEAVVPYSAAALREWLGGTPDHYCSERTARAMAMAAFERARALSEADPYSLRGIGATASLVSNRPKRGAHRIHVAWQSAEATVVVSCELEKGLRTRAEEEQVATQLILNVIAEACGVEARLEVGGEGELELKSVAEVSTPPPAPPYQGGEIRGATLRREYRAPGEWTELLLGERAKVMVPEQSWVKGPQIALFPGAFHPIHAAHRRMAEIAAQQLRRPVTFELSIVNVDKPPLDFVEIGERLAQFAGEAVLLTRAPRFVQKAELAPGCTFVVGVDTIARIGDAQYYAAGVAERDAAIAAIAEAGCRFLVFGRSVQGEFRVLSDLAEVPAALRAVCDEVPESVFREDISSTELRA